MPTSAPAALIAALAAVVGTLGACNVSGTIHVLVRGNSQSVHLSSGAGSASLRLSR
jgi:hypothetical protein